MILQHLSPCQAVQLKIKICAPLLLSAQNFAPGLYGS
jgi:hypothetical protein